MDHNYFEDGASAAILVLDIRGTGPITNARVEHNEMVRQFFGVVVLGSGGHTIADNLVTSAGRDGILIRAANENVVAGNEVYGSARDGIRADSGSAGNLFEHNRMLGNLEHDAHDTNRVANTWIRNECATDLPAGTICAA
jgi:parallel beta-helix repeat protein